MARLAVTWLTRPAEDRRIFPAQEARMLSVIVSTVRAPTSPPQAGQCGIPSRAYRTRR